MSLEITDYYELLALHRCVLEAKFHSDPEDGDIADSPLVAGLANRILEALEQAESQRGKPGEVKNWERWRKIDRRTYFWKTAVSFAVAYPRWSELGAHEKRELVATLLAPFVATDSDFVEFCSLVENRKQKTLSSSNVAGEQHTKSDFAIKVLQRVGDEINDNVDVEVQLSGERYSATFATLKNLENILAGYRETGECLSGKYFWCSGLILIEDLSPPTIRDSVEHLIAIGEFSKAFEGPHND